MEPNRDSDRILDIVKIPTTILSRFEIFEICSQSPQANVAILKSICGELASEYPGIEFDEDLLVELFSRTPREQRQLLQSALSRAVRMGDSTVTVKHLERTAAGRNSERPTRSIGFRGAAG